jgi:SNF2 family DNA or RNA helicase
MVNMGVISDCLWALRFAATAPNDYTHLQGRGPGKALEHREYNKVKTIIDMVKRVKESREKVVIFSGLRSMVDNIDKELGRHQISAMKITSSMNCLKRFGAIEKFQNNGYTALVAGLNVLNRGYTITKANHVIICDLEYQPESTEQAEDRVHRTGQEKPVTVTYLLSKDTIDELMLEVITQKREAISHSINGTAKYASTAELLKQMDNRNVELMIAKKVLESRRTFFPTKPALNPPESVIKPVVLVLLDNADWVNAKQLSLFD